MRARISDFMELEPGDIEPRVAPHPDRREFELAGPQYSSSSGLILWKIPPPGYEPTEEDVFVPPRKAPPKSPPRRHVPPKAKGSATAGEQTVCGGQSKASDKPTYES